MFLWSRLGTPRPCRVIPGHASCYQMIGQSFLGQGWPEVGGTRWSCDCGQHWIGHVRVEMALHRVLRNTCTSSSEFDFMRFRATSEKTTKSSPFLSC